MNENELQALASLLDEDDKDILIAIEKQIYMLGSQMIPFLEREWQKQSNQKTQKRIKTIVNHLHFCLVLQRFKEWKESEQTDLLHGLWIIASYYYHEISLENLNSQIESFYQDVLQIFRDDLHPYDQVKVVNSIVFGKFRFKTNGDFQAIDNSMINKVLETRLGNPIALSAVYMMIAQKLGLPIYGVNLPNIFILTYKTELHQFYINPTNKGVIFNRADIENYIEQLAIPTSDVYYEPCKNIDILKRILRNLGYAFEKQNLATNVEEVKEMLKILE